MNNENEHQDSTLYRHAPEKIWLNLEEAKCGYDDLFPMDSDKDIPWKRLHWEDEAGVEYIRADLAGQEAPQWKPIETAPKMRKVVVSYLNSLGKSRTVMACYYNPETLELHDDYEGHSEDGYCAEGWYEDHEHDAPLMRLEFEPTHWMPLPTAPQAEAEEGE